MALPINIEDLPNKRKVESNRIVFKAFWYPDKVCSCKKKVYFSF